MSKETPNTKLQSVYVVRFLLEVTGFLLVLFGLFGSIMTYGLPAGWHGGGDRIRMIATPVFLLLDGLGFLLPKLWAKLFSAVLLAVAGAWIFSIDAYRRENWVIYCLLLVPLLGTLWLRRRSSALPPWRLVNAN